MYVGKNQHYQILKEGKQLKELANIEIQSLSDNPDSQDFLGLQIIDNVSGTELCRFRSDNIVLCRRFMASLGGTGDGLFTKLTGRDCEPIITIYGSWDVVHSSTDQLTEQHQIFEKHLAKVPKGKLPTYLSIVDQLPIEFYFPPDTGIDLSPGMNFQLALGQLVPKYDPKLSNPKVYRRPWHDTFKSPNGPPTFFPINIGYGQEVGLETGIQALWDPHWKTYFFLDHFHKISTFKDPRPPLKSKPVVKRQTIQYGDKKHQANAAVSKSVCFTASVIKATANRALSKPQGCVLYARGKNGKHGSPGAKGKTGACGLSGMTGVFPGGFGGHGSHGNPGYPGSNGERGADGTKASDVFLNISGNSSELKLKTNETSTYYAAKLGGPETEEVLFINCRGGDGGHGGQGGKGGNGGRGGNGGNGATGRYGMFPGENGGPGGNGGNGENGGPGGRGGKGGDGGNAGNGGICVIQSSTPQLLMLVEVDCTAGKKGIAGNGGIGGPGGPGGLGGRFGLGGPGGPPRITRNSDGTTSYHYTMPGPIGFSGHGGYPGSRGLPGARGINGKSAKDGGILWMILSSEGDVLYESATRYDAEVTAFNVTSGIDDGVFEPNEQILVSKCCVINKGGLPLPSGATLFMPSTKTIKFKPTQYELPSEKMFPNQSFIVPITYYGRIFDQPPPNAPGPFVSSAQFHPRIDILGRPFEKSYLHRKLTVQYPVKLAYLKSSENFIRGEVGVLDIGVQNISSMPYGDSLDSGGKVFLHIHLDARIIPVGSTNICTTFVPYTITYDPNIRDSMYIQMHKIPAGQTVNVQITVQMEGHAELFDRCLWQADLYLRGKLIEYNFKKIRVSIPYTPQDSTADILMITDNSISRKEFVFWEKVFEVLQLSVDFWDTIRYNGLSINQTTNNRHQTSWEGRYKSKLILYPHFRPDLLWSKDIVSHFHGTQPAHTNTYTDLQSSMLLFLEDSPVKQRQGDQFYDHGDQIVLQHLATAREEDIHTYDYGGRHLFTPGTCFTSDQPYHKWEKKYLKKMEEQVPYLQPIVYDRVTNIVRNDSLGFLWYGYGQVDIRKIPLRRSCKFAVYDGAGGNLCSTMSLDDINVTPSSTKIPLASNYGQVFLMTVYGMPLNGKLKLLKSQEQVSTIDFLLPNKYLLSIVEVVMITLAWEIADELYADCVEPLSALRMDEFAKDIQENTMQYAVNGVVVARGLKLIQAEIKERKKKTKNSHGRKGFINDVNHYVSQTLYRLNQFAGVDICNLPSLPSMKCLIDGSRVHFSHQHRIKDERWNLPGM